MKPTATARVDLNGSFDADELEEIIRTLAETRASLHPPVPPEPPSSLAAVAQVQDNALFKIRTLADGGLRIWLRNEGIGWLAFTVSPAAKLGLRDFLGKELGHSHTAH